MNNDIATGFSSNEKKCIGCNCIKSKSEFRKQAIHADGLNKHCNDCIESKNRHKKPRKKVTYEKNREYNLKKKFGMTLDDFNKILNNQFGGCAICGDVSPAPVRSDQRHGFVVDHCHETGVVRAILCQSCNKAIGFLREDPTIAQRTADYLLNWIMVVPNEH